MKRHIFSIILLIASAFTPSKAIVVQKFCLKDGSVIYGYIVKQDPMGNMTIAADRATRSMAGNAVKIVSERWVGEADLSDEWREWANDNDAFVCTAEGRKLCMADLTVSDATATKSFAQVCLLERGARVTFATIKPITTSVKWDDVMAIMVDRRKPTELSGIDLVYHLTDGTTIEGQYAGETERTLSLYDKWGMKTSFDIDQVVVSESKAINAEQDFFEQCPTLDFVTTSSGEKLEGYIVKQDYSSEHNALTIRLRNGELREVKMDDVKETMRTENVDGYKPIIDFIAEGSLMYVNRKATPWTTLNETEGGIGVAISKANFVKNCASVALGAKEVNLEYNEQTCGPINGLQLIKMTSTTEKKSISYGFTYKNLSSLSSTPSTSTLSPNGTRKLVFEVYSPGEYAIYNNATRKAILLKVE